MVVSYYRGKESLGELLGGLVRGVIDDKNLHINLVSVNESLYICEMILESRQNLSSLKFFIKKVEPSSFG
jgi:hypothetical protein